MAPTTPPSRLIDKVGFALLHKGIVDSEVIGKALTVKEREQGSQQRTMAQILVSDFQVDHDMVFTEVAKVYAFKEIRLDETVMDEARIKFISQMLETLTLEQRNYLAEAKALPFRYDDQAADKLIIIAADPTHRHIPRIAYYFRARKYEVYFTRLAQLQPFIDSFLRKDNVFLDSIKDLAGELHESDFEAGIDEAALDQEINKSMLVNFFEGCLVEAVRQGASDIHVVPSGARSTDFHFRVDGKLKIWNHIEGTRPD